MTRLSSTRAQPKPTALAAQWREYHATGDRASRDHLILAYSPMVKQAAGQMKSRMPDHVDIADLISYGLGGLINAVARFDPERGSTFESYARLRIRGAITDELRALDWVPRAVRAEARTIERATSALSQRLQRAPTEAEMAQALAMTPAEFGASLLRVANSSLTTLDGPLGTGSIDGDGSSLLDTHADPTADDPVASMDAEIVRDRVADAVSKLSERSQLVIALRYHENLTLAEIGEVLGVTASRVSQLHTAAVLQLRALLQPSN